MIYRLVRKGRNRFLSRWVVLVFDASIATVSIPFAYLLRFNFNLEFVANYPLGSQFSILLCTYLLGFLILRPFAGIIRHTSIKDLEKILIANSIALSVGLIVNFSVLDGTFYRIPASIFLIQFLVVTFIMSFSRFLIKNSYYHFSKKSTKRKKVIIYGADKLGLVTKQALDQYDELTYQVLAFVDDSEGKIGKKLEGIQVIPTLKIDESFIGSNDIEEVILATDQLGAIRRNELIDFFLTLDLDVKNIPPVTNWINGGFSAGQIRQVNIEDLLEREVIQLEREIVSQEIREKVVLVTGAAGSIGSEISRQVLELKPEKLILVDQAESALYDLELELLRTYNGSARKRIECQVLDIRRSDRLECVFKKYRPNVVFHAAAYKHVPLMESNPVEAVDVNVYGTKSVADLSIAYEVERFVLVSTDKAVNPTNVMGASKRIAEMYCQSIASGQTKFITTRFGNVLGSNGSVIPLFKRQIAAGGPVTVTDKEVTRFFMTIPEACSLVLEAGAMGAGGEIYVFDMGKQVRIYDLALKMIRLSGFSEEEIEIKVTGLRPGEKLFEEVLSEEENTKPTHHPKINIAKVRNVNRPSFEQKMLALQLAHEQLDAMGVVSQMKQIVPEYKSQNSPYEVLDNIQHSELLN